MKYFLVSDIHSFYKPLKKSLDAVGFDINNNEHTLVVLGDVFDRGSETLKVFEFLSSIPKERCILIRGNHEQLYLDLLNKSYPEGHDFSNGTVHTFCQIAGYGLDTEYDLRVGSTYMWNFGDIDDYNFVDTWKEIKRKVKKSEVTKWLNSNQWINYYEINNYICVHSFIPLKYNEERNITEEYAIYYAWTQLFEFIPDWRNATDKQWEQATWGCAYKFFDAGLFDKEKENGKILVCGHYRCSEFNQHYLNWETYNVYYGDNLIAIDATTALNNQVNVVVIDGDKCYDQYGLLVHKKPLPVIETVTLDKEEYEKYTKDVTNS